MRIAVAEHRREPVRRHEFREIAIADEIEKRLVGVEGPRVADDENADRQAVKYGPGVAPNLLVGAAAGRGALILGACGRLPWRHDPQLRPVARGVVAPSRRPADEGAGDLAEGVALAPGEFDALGGETVERLPGVQSVQSAGANRNDV